MPKSVIYKRTASKASKNSSTKKSTPRSTSSKKKSWNPLKWFLVAAVVAAVPLTISLSQGTLDLRQRASTYMPYDVWIKSSYAQDYNKDKRIDIQDYTIWLKSYEPTTVVVPTASVTGDPNCVKADFNNDGKVDEVDYNIVVANRGKTGQGIQGDADLNGIVDEFDYMVVKRCMVLSTDKPTSSPQLAFEAEMWADGGTYGTINSYGAVKVIASARGTIVGQSVPAIGEIVITDLTSKRMLKKCLNVAKCETWWNPNRGTYTLQAKVTSKQGAVDTAENTYTRSPVK